MPERADGVLRQRAWMAAYVVAMFLSFPHPLPFLEGAVLDLGIVSSLAVPVCLVLGLAGRSVRQASVSSFGWTVVAHGFVLHFIYVVTVTYGRAPAVIGLIAPFALATYAATLAALFGAGWVWLRDRGQGNAFTAALLWTALDQLRGVALSGWPWATLGYAQHLNPGLMGLAQWTGVYGLSFTVVLAGVALLELSRSLARGERPGLSTSAALAAVVVLHGFGFATRIQPGVNDSMGEATIRVAAIQGNIDQGVKWDRASTERTIGIYEDLSRQAAAAGAEIIVWPETAVPGALEADVAMQDRVRALARETGASFVVGSVGLEFDRASGRVSHFFDSAFLVEPSRGFTERYDKSHLVPFGEYVPLRGLLGGLLGAVASGMSSGDVTAGEAPRALDLRVEGRAGPRRLLRVGVPICYELLFPHLVRRFVNDGGGILFGITNDAWYGRTGAPYQFLAITALRSAETGVYTVRAANTGVSAVIDSGGWVREQTRIFESGYLVADVPLRRVSETDSNGKTFYVRQGDVFAATCWVALAAAFLLAYRNQGASRESGE
jgi:apolipoprotein N-acyltransferase